jgi:hypothetical protein
LVVLGRAAPDHSPDEARAHRRQPASPYVPRSPRAVLPAPEGKGGE